MHHVKCTDSELLGAAREGGTLAYAELYRRHLSALMTYARSLAGPSLAEDLVQEAMVRTWSQLEAGNGPRTNFAGYARAAIHNAFLNEVRRAQRINHIGNAGEGRWMVEESQLPTTPSAEALAVTSLEHRRISQAIAALQPRWRHVLTRVYLEGAPWEQVASELSVRVSAAHQLAHRARQGLLRSLADENEAAA